MNESPKVCTHCKEAKPADAVHFARTKLRPSGLASWCRECSRVAVREANQKASRRAGVPKRRKVIAGLLECAKCLEQKLADTKHFPPNKKTRSGLNSWCRDCMRAASRECMRKRKGSKPKQYRVVVEGKLPCTRCGETKPATLEHFAPRKNKSGFASWCKACEAEHRKTESYRARRRIWQKERERTHPQFRIGRVLRIRLRQAVRAQLRGKTTIQKPPSDKVSAIRDLGCTIPELMHHLEQQFQPDMTWGNYGTWHIDHTTPLSSFDLTDPEQARAACRFSNLQPLWAEENLKKGSQLCEQAA